MIRRPPRSTLFPTRRSSDLEQDAKLRDAANRLSQALSIAADDLLAKLNARSEEHTSELQSHLNLVCRLLLEKKKNSQRQLHPGSLHSSSLLTNLQTSLSKTE